MSVSVSRFYFVKTFYRRLRIFMRFAERCQCCVRVCNGGRLRWWQVGFYISLLVIIVSHRVKRRGDGRCVYASVYCALLLVRRKILRLYFG